MWSRSLESSLRATISAAFPRGERMIGMVPKLSAGPFASGLTHGDNHAEQALGDALNLLLNLHLGDLGVVEDDVARLSVDLLLWRLVRLLTTRPISLILDLAAGKKGEEAGRGNNKVEELVVNRADELPSLARGVVGEDQRRKLLEKRPRERGREGEVVG